MTLVVVLPIEICGADEGRVAFRAGKKQGFQKTGGWFFEWRNIVFGYKEPVISDSRYDPSIPDRTLAATK